MFNYCLTNKYAASLCRNEHFWRNRFVQKYGQEAGKYKPENRSWRKHYLKVVSDLDQYEPWEFLQTISWDMGDEIKFYENEAFDKAPVSLQDSSEFTKNNYWLSNLGNKIKIGFDIDRYSDLPEIVREYRTDKYFTPAQIIDIVRKFYSEKISPKELQEQIDIDNPEAEDYTMEEAQNGEVSRLDLLGGKHYFEGFHEENGIFHINFGS